MRKPPDLKGLLRLSGSGEIGEFAKPHRIKSLETQRLQRTLSRDTRHRAVPSAFDEDHG